MRKYKDAFDWAVVPAKLDAATAAIEAKRRLKQLHKEAAWRLNEKEAEVMASYLGQFWQSLLPNYGERRNGGESDYEYLERWNGKLNSLNLGDFTRKSPLLPQ